MRQKWLPAPAGNIHCSLEAGAFTFRFFMSEAHFSLRADVLAMALPVFDIGRTP